MNRSLVTHPLFVAILWLAAYSTAVVVAIESILGEITPAALQMVTKIMAYVGATGNAGFVLVSLALFTLSSGLMLRWLDTAVSTRALARLVAGSCWPLVTFTWLMLGVLMAKPPRSLTIEEVNELPREAGAIDNIFGFAWLTEAQYAVMILFLATLSISLARRCGWLNAVIGIACGIATVSVIGVAFIRLATLMEG